MTIVLLAIIAVLLWVIARRELLRVLLSVTRRIAFGKRMRPEKHNVASVNVLLIDDDPFLTAMYAKKLSEIGARPTMLNEVTSDLVERVVALAPDVICTDVVVPMSYGDLRGGAQATSMLQNDLRTAHIPIVFLTNQLDPRSISEAKQFGATAYIVMAHHEPLEVAEMICGVVKLWPAERFSDVRT